MRILTATPSIPLLIGLQAVISGTSMSVEIVAGRMLAPYVGMSLYTWTAIIAVVLAGFSAGHWWGGRLAERGAARALGAAGWTLVGAALTTGGAVWLLHLSAASVLSALPDPVWGITALCMVVFFAPSLFAGVPAPILAQVAVETAPRTGPALGAMFAAGAVGAIAGTLLAGFVFISWLGSTLTLVLLTGVYAVCALILLACGGRKGQRWLTPLIALLTALGLAGSALARPNACDVESRYFCLRSVDVSADPDHPARLMVLDHLAHGIGARDAPRIMFTDHTAMLDAISRMRMGRAPFSSFFIGGGSYSIPRAWHDRGTGSMTVAEIDPAVTALAASDFWFDPSTARVLHQDARRALATRNDRYDVIVGDAFTDIAVPAHLVTREFFALVRDRLTPQGVFVMNVIDFEDRLHALASLTATLDTVFPAVEIWTRAERPAPGARMVFVLVAANTPSPNVSVTTPAPALSRFGALSEDFMASLRARDPVILTDDYAPIDRLVGTGPTISDAPR